MINQAGYAREYEDYFTEYLRKKQGNFN